MGDAKLVQKSNDHFPYKLECYWENPIPKNIPIQIEVRISWLLMPSQCGIHGQNGRTYVRWTMITVPFFATPELLTLFREFKIDAHARRNVSKRAESKRPPVFGGQTTLHREFSLQLTKTGSSKRWRIISLQVATRLYAGCRRLTRFSQNGEIWEPSQTQFCSWWVIKIKQHRKHFDLFWVSKNGVLHTANHSQEHLFSN